jgi:phosphate:Na+ symporter
MIAHVLATLLSGLGLFFIGVKLVGDNMKQMAGRKFRQVVSRVTQNRFLAGGWGLVAGALLQSSSAITFIVASVISAGLIQVRKALPIISWSNVGGSVLVLLAVLDIHLFALYLLGATGLCFYLDLDKSPRYRNLAGALLGIGLLFLGLDLIKSGAASLKEFEALRQFLDYSQHSYALVFVAGALITFIAQSRTTVSVIAVTMAAAGLIGINQTMMLIYGSNLGSGLNTVFLSSNLRGSARQASIFLTLFKVAGVALLVPAFYLEIYSGLPLIKTLAELSRRDTGGQMAMVYLILQLVSALLVAIFTTPILKLLERLAPPTHEEALSKPQFLLDQALEEPETALDLVEKESLRLTKRFPDYLDSIREETKTKQTIKPESIHQASQSLLKELDGFMTDLMDQNMSRHSLERGIAIRNLTGLIASLEESLFDWTMIIHGKTFSGGMTRQIQLLAESLHAVLMSLVDAMESPDRFNLEVIEALSADRSDSMEELRKSVLREETSLPYAEQQALYAITNVFERIFWLMRKIALLLSGLYAKTE